jgi:hypothetical protein
MSRCLDWRKVLCKSYYIYCRNHSQLLFALSSTSFTWRIDLYPIMVNKLCVPAKFTTTYIKCCERPRTLLSSLPHGTKNTSIGLYSPLIDSFPHSSPLTRCHNLPRLSLQQGRRHSANTFHPSASPSPRSLTQIRVVPIQRLPKRKMGTAQSPLQRPGRLPASVQERPRTHLVSCTHPFSLHIRLGVHR